MTENEAENLPNTRNAARLLGSKHYFTGAPCSKGHIAKRLTNSCHCTECLREQAASRYHLTKEETRDDRNAKARQRYKEGNEQQRKQIGAAKARRRNADKEKYLALEKAERARNPERFRDATRRWRDRNPDKAREVGRMSAQRIRATPSGKLNASMSSGIRHSLIAGAKANRSWEALIGYTIFDLMDHLEKLFSDGMSFDNYGEWEIDHIIPLSVHNFEVPEDLDFKKAWSLSNLQPLWAMENRRKSNKLSAPFQPSLMLRATNDNNTTKDVVDGATNA